MSKPRILLLSESSYITSGYGVYCLNLLNHLHDTGKYEIAEIGSWASNNDPRIKSCKWRFFPNIPHEPHLQEQFHARPSNVNGEFVFDAACLEFRPDVVCAIRDYWQDEYISVSPARPYFKYIQMAQVDSAPQKSNWINSFSAIDLVLTYTDWGLQILKEQGQGNINLFKAAGYGVDVNHFKPLDQKFCRNSLCIPEDAFIIGTVQRNQQRKLYFDLMQTFARFLETAPAPIAAKSYLYIHSRYPDMSAGNSWEFPELIRELGIGHRTFFSYVCKTCRAVFSSLYRGPEAICTGCGNKTAEMPGIQNGISPNILAMIFNSMDLYLQYSTCEGLGLPQIEAAACSTPVMAVDYSAMFDVVRKIYGVPIKVQRMFRDINVGADRAYPDNDDLLKKMVDFARMPTEMRLRYKQMARKGVEENCLWSKIGKVWEDAIDLVGNSNWDAPKVVHKPITSLPNNMNNEQFINWGFDQAKRPELKKSRFFHDMLIDLERGYFADKNPCSREILVQHFNSLGNTKNMFEKQRCGG